ncbi:MAG: C1 family peptidase [Spirochaetales bacterium]|nr:C1 family peptidase [Spirochaetales bacterium]
MKKLLPVFLLLMPFFFACGDLNTTEDTTEIVDDESTDDESTDDESTDDESTDDESSDDESSDDAASTDGAFKFVNSWGAYSSVWENVLDGHYWIEYEDMKDNGFYIYYYYNDDSEVYDPTAIAVFNIDHDYRDEVSITIGVQDDEGDTVYSKTLESTISNILSGGAEPFPDNDMALDITEFADSLDDYNFFLTAENSGDTEGTIESLSLELYTEYDSSGASVAQTFAYEGGSVTIGASSTVTIELETAGNIDSSWEASLSSSSLLSTSSSFTFRDLTDSEISSLLTTEDQISPSNEVVMGDFGTGWSAPTSEEWEEVSYLEGLSTISKSGSYDGVSLPDEVDLSAEEYFPPVGNQGGEGSCAAFSAVYYIHTYMEAREHGWDLSDVGWTYSSSTSNGGEPDSDLDKIFSPDFVYHQINFGTDGGSTSYQALESLIRQGCASWETMPYDTSDSTSWPSEEAWREAPLYRSDTDSYYTGSKYSGIGFFKVEDDDDILFLKYLLSEGYPVTTAIYGGSSSDYGLYDELDENDVLENGNSWSSSYWNHAQTIVGYKEGDEWDSSNPED